MTHALYYPYSFHTRPSIPLSLSLSLSLSASVSLSLSLSLSRSLPLALSRSISHVQAGARSLSFFLFARLLEGLVILYYIQWISYI